MTSVRRQRLLPFDPWTAFLPPRGSIETPPSMSLAGGSLRSVEVRGTEGSPRDSPRPGRPLTKRRCIVSRRTFSFACTPGTKTREVPVGVVSTGELASLLVVVRLHAISTVPFASLRILVVAADRTADDPAVLFLGDTLAMLSLPGVAPSLQIVSLTDPPPRVQLVVQSGDGGLSSGYQVAAISVDVVGRYR